MPESPDPHTIIFKKLKLTKNKAIHKRTFVFDIISPAVRLTTYPACGGPATVKPLRIKEGIVVPTPQATAERLAEHAPRTWQRMLSGRRLNLLDPSPMDIEIEDIALGLARNTRWNGQTQGDHGWSVAQHSELVVDIVRRIETRARADLLMAALLHDASEYVTHDLITPLKAVVGDVFMEVENRLLHAIRLRFGLTPQLSDEVAKLIKRADKIAAVTEAVQLAGFSKKDARSVLGFREKPIMDLKLVPLPVAEAEQRFLEGFHTLEKALTLQKRSGP